MKRGRAIVIRTLERLRETSNFKRASFTDFHCGPLDVKFPCAQISSDELTEAIRKTTELYRSSWVTPLIDALIAYEKGDLSAREIERLL